MSRNRLQIIGIGTLTLIVVVIATAFAVGGSSLHHKLRRLAPVGVGTVAPPHASHGVAAKEFAGANIPAQAGIAPDLATQTAPSLPTSGGGSGAGASTGSATGTAGTVAGGAPSRVIDNSNSGSSVDATRIVKTGDLQLRVSKGAVQSTMGQLSGLAAHHGGYVAQSNTDTNPTNPNGDITLRVPVAQFAATVTDAEKLGHVESLSTEAKDVTGKYVDLNARMHALQSTRSTYLSILSRATTIGETLSVQQRIDDVQQQIDQLHGQIKLLASQSAFSTLEVRVDQPTIIAVTKVHHKRHGLAQAWHKSIHRFTRGIDAIVAAVGPLLLALLLIALAYVVIRLGARGVRRHRSSGAAS